MLLVHARGQETATAIAKIVNPFMPHLPDMALFRTVLLEAAP